MHEDGWPRYDHRLYDRFPIQYVHDNRFGARRAQTIDFARRSRRGDDLVASGHQHRDQPFTYRSRSSRNEDFHYSFFIRYK
jgi:hypothetical protein